LPSAIQSGLGKFLVRADSVVYPIIVMLTAFLPARLAYGVAILRGDLLYRWDSETRVETEQLIQTAVESMDLTPSLESVTRAYFRNKSCSVVDGMRLLGDGKALSGLVEVRGLNYLDAAIVGGKGALLFSSHSLAGSAYALLGTLGYPVAMIGRWSSAEDINKPILFILNRLYRGRPVNKSLGRPLVEKRSGAIGVAVKAAFVLRGNGIVGIAIDALVKSKDISRPVAVSFLNRRLLKAPGAVSLAQLTGAPLLMLLMHRKADFRHQTMVISPPMSVKGDTAEVFTRCLGLVEADIRRHPAEYNWGAEVWFYEKRKARRQSSSMRKKA
jgi:lauroyl/myristoyl acyltransferase